jgi:hypothetical protein
MDGEIEVKALRDGWYAGKIGCYRFQAKVYDTGSKFGINKGRVSKLDVWNEFAGVPETDFRYDRGWDKKPESDEHWELLWEMLSCLEELPING